MPLFHISGDIFSGVSKPCSHCEGEHDVYFLISTSGATPTDLFDSQLSTSIVPHILLPAEVRLQGLKTTT